MYRPRRSSSKAHRPVVKVIVDLRYQCTYARVDQILQIADGFLIVEIQTELIE